MTDTISNIKTFLSQKNVDINFLNDLDPSIAVGVLNEGPSFYLLKVKTNIEFITYVFDDTSVLLQKATKYANTTDFGTGESVQISTILDSTIPLENFVTESRNVNLDVLTLQNLDEIDNINNLNVQLVQFISFFVAKLKNHPNLPTMINTHFEYLGLVEEVLNFISTLLQIQDGFSFENLPAYFGEWQTDTYQYATEILVHILLFDFLSQAQLIDSNGNALYVENYNDMSNPKSTSETPLDDLWKEIVLNPTQYESPENLDDPNADQWISPQLFDVKFGTNWGEWDLNSLIKYNDNPIFSDENWWKWIKEELIKKIGGDVIGIPFDFFKTFIEKVENVKKRYDLVTNKTNGLVLRNALWKAIKDQSNTNSQSIYTLPTINEYEVKNVLDLDLSNDVTNKDLAWAGWCAQIALLDAVKNTNLWSFNSGLDVKTSNSSSIKNMLTNMHYSKRKKHFFVGDYSPTAINICQPFLHEYYEDVENTMTEIVVATGDTPFQKSDTQLKVELDAIRTGMNDALQAQTQANTIIDKIQDVVKETGMIIDPTTQIPEEGQEELKSVDVVQTDTFVQAAVPTVEQSNIVSIKAMPMQTVTQNNVYTNQFQFSFIK